MLYVVKYYDDRKRLKIFLVFMCVNLFLFIYILFCKKCVYVYIYVYVLLYI